MALGLLVLPACGGGAQARLELRNDTGYTGAALRIMDVLPVTTPSSTTHFAMRLSKVYLVPDVDGHRNPTGPSALLWSNPRCADPAGCDYFELARPSAEVNADLASQPQPVDAGTYKYVQLEFCAGGPTGPNVSWQGDGMTAPHEFMFGMCGVTSEEISPPLELKSGDSVSISLGYDLAGSSVVGDVTGSSPPTMPALTAPDGHGVGYNDCAAQSSPAKKTCFNVPAFHPTASKI